MRLLISLNIKEKRDDSKLTTSDSGTSIGFIVNIDVMYVFRSLFRLSSARRELVGVHTEYYRRYLPIIIDFIIIDTSQPRKYYL